MNGTLCIDGGHSHHQFGVNLVGFHAIIFTVSALLPATAMGILGKALPTYMGVY